MSIFYDSMCFPILKIDSTKDIQSFECTLCKVIMNQLEKLIAGSISKVIFSYSMFFFCFLYINLISLLKFNFF